MNHRTLLRRNFNGGSEDQRRRQDVRGMSLAKRALARGEQFLQLRLGENVGAWNPLDGQTLNQVDNYFFDAAADGLESVARKRLRGSSRRGATGKTVGLCRRVLLPHASVRRVGTIGAHAAEVKPVSATQGKSRPRDRVVRRRSGKSIALNWLNRYFRTIMNGSSNGLTF
jgi:hypothetical protein